MILCIGIDTDATFRNFLVQSVARKVAVQPLNLRALIERGDWAIHIDPRRSSQVMVDGQIIVLEPGTAVFHRIINLGHHGKKDLESTRWHALTRALRLWIDRCAGRHVNPLGAGADNGCKPLHEAVLSKAGFSVPPAITSGNKEILLKFLQQYPDAIAKTLCGTRSSCRSINAADLQHYHNKQGPVHLQQRIFGSDTRVHVVRDKAFIAHASSSGVDYREAKDAQLSYSNDFPFSKKEKIIAHTKKRNLVLAGWDFKIDEAGKWWCLEVNPMPGFDGHDRAIGGAIIQETVRFLRNEK